MCARMYETVAALPVLLAALAMVVVVEGTSVMITQPSPIEAIRVNSSQDFVCTVSNPDSDQLSVRWFVQSFLSSSSTREEIDVASPRFEASERSLPSLTSTRVFVLTSLRVEYSDDGIWTCQVETATGAVYQNSSKVIVQGRPIIVVDPSVEHLGSVDENLTLVCDVIARPAPNSLYWEDPDGNRIRDGAGYVLNVTTQDRRMRTLLEVTILQFQPTMAGSYACVATNENGQDRHPFPVAVYPYVTITDPTTNPTTSGVNDRIEITCHARNFGGQRAPVKWSFKPTPSSPETSLTDNLDPAKGAITTALTAISPEYVTETKLTLYQAQFADEGEYICRVTLFHLDFTDTVFMNVQGVPQVSLPTTTEVDVGENVRLECRVAAIPRVDQVTWLVNGDVVDTRANSRFIITDDFTNKLQSVSMLDVYGVTTVEIGATTITCRAKNSIGTTEAATRFVSPVRCTPGSNNCGPNEDCVKRNTMFACQCRANFHRNNNGVCEDDNECALPGICGQVCVNEVGSYYCSCYPDHFLAADQRSCVYQDPNIVSAVTNPTPPTNQPQSNNIGVIIGIVVSVCVIIILIAVVVFILLRRRAAGYKGRSKPRKEGVYNASFHNNADDNSVLSPNDMGYRKRPLPPIQYHSYTEISTVDGDFPRSRLRLLDSLGEGRFGKVVQAEALDLLRRGKWDLVAVKTVKETATDADKEDFFHELMINKSIPKHQNVVAYLAAVISSDPVMMILEFVDGGNLLTFLRSRRHPPGFRHSDITEAHDLTTRDLFSFALQAARGMAHLAAHKIIHRDVAARNVLLQGHTCKISDFGLSRNVEGSDVYERTSRGPLPIRWMAPECFRDNLHSTESDVWAFGVLLWEIVTLGASPYPGFSASQVMTAVLDGKRLERPPHCAQELYDIMSQCWMEAPGARPPFTALARTFETLLEREGEYLQLDDLDEAIYCVLEPSATEERV